MAAEGSDGDRDDDGNNNESPPSPSSKHSREEQSASQLTVASETRPIKGRRRVIQYRRGWSVLGDLQQLEYFNCSDNAMRGSLPTSIGELRQLRVLSCRDNQFAGRLPREIVNCVNLRDFRFQNNDCEDLEETKIWLEVWPK